MLILANHLLPTVYIYLYGKDLLPALKCLTMSHEPLVKYFFGDSFKSNYVETTALLNLRHILVVCVL